MKHFFFLASALALIGAGCATNQLPIAKPVPTPVPPQAAPPSTPPSSPSLDSARDLPQRGGVTEPSAQAQTVNVTIKDFAFAPTTITINKGDKVVFTNQDGVGHTASSDAGAFESGMLNQGQSYTLDTSTLASGTYPYHCTPHPFMKATLIIK